MATTLHKLEDWADSHHPFWLDFLRIALGIFIFMKGITFIRNPEILDVLVGKVNLGFVAAGIGHYVIVAHLMGGLLITIGLLTRLSILFQLPILIGAVFIVNVQEGQPASELWISLGILILLLVFLLYGSGKISVNEYLETHHDK